MPGCAAAGGPGGKPAKRAVSFIVSRDRDPEREERRGGDAGDPRPPGPLLVVRRPPDDEELPGLWGLPAGSLRPGEGWKEAVVRAGREKLGVELEPTALLAEGTTERADYVLHMRLYGARIVEGAPSVPQPVDGITQYTAWRWAPAARLREAADRGSLCSRLCLKALGRES